MTSLRAVLAEALLGLHTNVLQSVKKLPLKRAWIFKQNHSLIPYLQITPYRQEREKGFGIAFIVKTSFNRKVPLTYVVKGHTLQQHQGLRLPYFLAGTADQDCRTVK